MSRLKEFEHLKIQLEAIKSATNNFADESFIGKGGFGKVYKGEIVHSEGQTMVALKRLDRAFGQGEVEFWKEITMLSQYKHENIVSLLGYCDECGENILVYEYVRNGSLDQYLRSSELTWVARLMICIGAARGLAYLHSAVGTQQRVLHRDIKSSNILLDENWNAKISDFGLSRIGPANQEYTFVVSHPVGTLGYCDPEYVETGFLTKESDVYSFGVVLFEVLCGRLSIDNYNDDHQPLVRLVGQFYEENKINEIIYGNIKDEVDPDSLKVFTDIAFKCLKREGRPLMSEIVKTLEIALQCQVFDKYQVADMDLLVKPFEVSVLNSSEAMKAPIDNEENAAEGRGLLVVTIHKGIDIIGKDPFIRLYLRESSHGLQKRTTRIVKDYETLVWNESFTFSCDKPPIDGILELYVRTSSWWRKCLRNDYLAFLEIRLKDVLKHKRTNNIYPLLSLNDCKIHLELQWVTIS